MSSQWYGEHLFVHFLITVVHCYRSAIRNGYLVFQGKNSAIILQKHEHIKRVELCKKCYFSFIGIHGQQISSHAGVFEWDWSTLSWAHFRGRIRNLLDIGYIHSTVYRLMFSAAWGFNAFDGLINKQEISSLNILKRLCRI